MLDATSQATGEAPGHATTPQAGTSRYATVREAADELGVSAETIRRMIRAGRLRAERVHRPQGTAWLVELPDATVQATADATGDVTVGRHSATPPPPAPPALLAAEAWARGIIEPLTRTIAEQQQLLVSQAETIGRLRAELDALRVPLDVPERPKAGHQPAERPDPTMETLAPWWRRWWATAVG